MIINKYYFISTDDEDTENRSSNILEVMAGLRLKILGLVSDTRPHPLCWVRCAPQMLLKSFFCEYLAIYEA